jgi:hypothetical protein
MASASVAAPKPNTFKLSGGLNGTITLMPKVACSSGPGQSFYEMTGKVSGIARVTSWTLNINARKTGKFKIAPSNFNIGVTLEPVGNPTLDTFDATSGTVNVAQKRGSLSLSLRSYGRNGRTATIKGGWNCP